MAGLAVAAAAASALTASRHLARARTSEADAPDPRFAVAARKAARTGIVIAILVLAFSVAGGACVALSDAISNVY